MNEELLRKEARRILDKFASDLGRVRLPEEKDLKKGVGGFREEGSGSSERGGGDFRERMFENAPSKDGDFIIAEKKKW